MLRKYFFYTVMVNIISSVSSEPTPSQLTTLINSSIYLERSKLKSSSPKIKSTYEKISELQYAINFDKADDQFDLVVRNNQQLLISPEFFYTKNITISVLSDQPPIQMIITMIIGKQENLILPVTFKIKNQRFESLKIGSNSENKANSQTISFDIMPYFQKQLQQKQLRNSGQCIKQILFKFIFQNGKNSNFLINITNTIKNKTSYYYSMIKQFQIYKNDLYVFQCNQNSLSVTSNELHSNFSLNSADNQSLKSTHFITLQYYNQTWPLINTVSFPVQMSPKLMLYADFENEHSTISFTGAFCIKIGFSKTNLSVIELNIIVCPYYTFQSQPEYKYNSGQINQTFYLRGNKTETNYDILEIPRKNTDLTKVINNMMIVKLEMGWMFYQGTATTQLKKYSFRIEQNNQTYNNQGLNDSTSLDRNSKKQQYFNSIGGNKTTKAAAQIVSIPNIGVILKLTPFIMLVDDFSYFVYHGQFGYDTGLDFVSELCWNLTHSKWQPPSFVVSALNMSLSSTEQSSEKWLRDSYNRTPPRLRYKTEDILFLNNCKGYLLYTVPFSALLFLVLWKLYWRFKPHKITTLIRSFSSWSFFGVSIICDNAQFLSFRAFSQIRFLVPQGVLGLVCSLIALTIQNILLVCAVCLYLLSWKWARKTFRSPFLRRRFNAFKILSLWICIKGTEGFIHAFIDDSLIRISTLLVLQSCMIISLVICGFFRFPQYKISYTLMTAGYIFKLALYFILMIEIASKNQINFTEINVIDTAFSKLTLTLFALIFICNVLQIILGVIASSLTKIPQTQNVNQNQIKSYIWQITNLAENNQDINDKLSFSQTYQNKYIIYSEKQNINLLEKCYKAKEDQSTMIQIHFAFQGNQFDKDFKIKYCHYPQTLFSVNSLIMLKVIYLFCSYFDSLSNQNKNVIQIIEDIHYRLHYNRIG